VLRDLSVSLDNVGQVARDLGRPEEAREAYQESLALRRQLRAALGDTPQVLRDLLTGLVPSAMLERNAGVNDAAEAYFSEARSTLNELTRKYPELPELPQLRGGLEALTSATQPQSGAPRGAEDAATATDDIGLHTGSETRS
jgi:tetratricopeptide (TPR) repeat protein